MKHAKLSVLLLLILALLTGCSANRPADFPAETESSPPSSESAVSSLSAEENIADECPLPEHTAAPLEEHERLFDTFGFEEQCRRLLSTFAPQSYTDWNSSDPSGLLSVYFKWYVERLFYLDTGREFEHTDGFTAAENYVTYATKYFTVDADVIREWIRQDSTYSAENDTVLLSDGLGSVVGAYFISVTPRENDYVIDYAVCGPDELPHEYAQLTFCVNPDGSFRFTGNTYTGELYSPAYSHDSYGGAVAVNKDGTLELNYGASLGYADLSMREVFVRDTSNGSNTRSLGFVAESAVSDVGFFSNGDIYLMDTSGLAVYRADLKKEGPIFTTKENFPAGGYFGYSPESRYLYAIRRDPESFDYIVIYSEYATHETVNPFQLAATYRVGRLDTDGNLIQSWDTGVPVMCTVLGPESVYLRKPGENEIELIVVSQKGTEWLRGRFDLTSGSYTPVREFVLPADPALATAEMLAEKQLAEQDMMLSMEWAPDKAELPYAYAVINVLSRLYQKDNGRLPPAVKAAPNQLNITDAFRIGDLTETAARYYAFDEGVLDAYFRSLDCYNPENHSIYLGDGWGWNQTAVIHSVTAEGDVYVIRYDLTYYNGDVTASGILTARLQGDHLQFISNKHITE